MGEVGGAKHNGPMLLPVSPWGLDPVAAAAQLGAVAGSPHPASATRPLEGRANDRGTAAPRGPKSL